LCVIYQRNSTSYGDDSESDDESNTVDTDKEEFLEEQFLLAELDAKTPDDDTPKPIIRADALNPVEGTPASSVDSILENSNPSTPASNIDDNHSIPTNSNPGALTNSVDGTRLPQDTETIVSAEEVTTITNSKPTYAPMGTAFSDLEVSEHDQDPLLNPKSITRAKEVVEDRAEQDEDKEFIQCEDL